jgi:hypothetical protein
LELNLQGSRKFRVNTTIERFEPESRGQAQRISVNTWLPLPLGRQSRLLDRAFGYVLAELKRINKTVMEQWGSEKSSLKGNRVILVGLPQLGAEKL